MPRTRSLIKYWLPVLLWMGVIFIASSDRGSFQRSSRLIGPLVQWIFPHLTAETLHTMVVFVRKCAHVTEYAVLAVLVWRALGKPVQQAPSLWHWPVAARTALFVMLYAASDEFHQLFVPSRDASVWDVLLDTSGAVLVLLVLWGLGMWRRQRRNQSKSAVGGSP